MNRLNSKEIGREYLEMKGSAVQENVSAAVAGIDSFLKRLGCPDSRRRDIDAIADDACSNITDYAYDESDVAAGRDIMEIICRAGAGFVDITFRDRGAEFNPLDYGKPDPDDIPQLGGLGIHLIRELSDNVEYVREKGCNVLRVKAGWDEH